MLTLLPGLSAKDKLQVLLLGAHSDDIEIGCGGTILRLAAELANIDVHWVVFSALGKRENEAQESADDFLSDVEQPSVKFFQFPDAYFPDNYSALKDAFKKMTKLTSPDIIFTHYRNDLHQDHRIISELTWNAFRDHLILEYEIPKYEGDLGQPNFFVTIPEEIRVKKISKLRQHFVSQRTKEWFSDDLFSSIMRIRGIEARSPSGFSEAFHCRKIRFI